MASYRYERDIDPKDIAPRKERQYTRKERWANWWDYNLKWVIIIGIAAAFVAYNFIGQYFFVTKPDYNVAVVAPYYLPEDTVNALQDALAAYGQKEEGLQEENCPQTVAGRSGGEPDHAACPGRCRHGIHYRQGHGAARPREHQPSSL
jgi:hypothetical protein